MNERLITQPNRLASQWCWLAPTVWLLVTCVALIIFIRGVPIFVENLELSYRTNFGFVVQHNSNNELFMLPDLKGQAVRAGVLERDVLVAVDGQLIRASEAMSLDYIIPVDEPGTAVTIQLRTGHRPTREITLIRGDQAGAWLHRFGIPLAAVLGLALGVELLVTVGFIAIAAFIFWRSNYTPAIWLSSLVLILVFASAGSLPVQSLYFAELDWQYGLDIWFSLIVATLILFLCLFPNGRFIPRWSVFLWPLCLLWVVVAWIRPELYFWRLAPQWYVPTLMVILLVGLFAQLWRFRLVSDRQQQQQTKWLVWGIGVALVAVFIQLATRQLLPDSPLLFDLLINPLTRLLQLLIPMTLALAIVQHRLWDIDIILNRTLVYGGLTGLITALYIFLVGIFSTLTVNQPGQIMGLILATALALVGFQPLRDRWQTIVNRYIPLPDPPPGQKSVPENADKTAVPLTGRKRRLAWLSLGLGLLLFVTIMVVTMLWGQASFDQWYFQFTGLEFLIVGTIIVLRRPTHRIGHLCLLTGWLFILALVGFFEGAALAPFLQAKILFPYAVRISLTLMQIVISLIFVYLPLLLPNGHYLNQNWRLFGNGLAIFTAVPILLTFIQPGLVFDWGEGQATTIVNPLAIHWLWLANIPQLTLIYWWGIPTMVSILVAIGSLFLRWRHSEGEIRQQTKWVVYFFSTFGFGFIAVELLFWLLNLLPFKEQFMATAAFALIESMYGILGLITWLGFPLIIGLAILRYRLFDIDIIINRTLVYGGLSLGIVVVYVLVVGALGALFQTQGNFSFALLATGLIAVLFQPVRERLQRGVNRFMFGERDDPYNVLSKLGEQLQSTSTPEATLKSVVETVATTLKLPHVAIELDDEQGRLPGASVGTAVAETVEFPLRYQNETVGYLVVSPRSPSESFTDRAQKLLAHIAAQTGAVASSVRLTAALQRSAIALQQSREKLVLTREEERRRIRRDLHDGLGPTLASQTFTMDAILKRLETAPQEAASLLHDLKAQNKEIVTEIRRLVYELRPPILDELGLLDALRAHVVQINYSQALQISVNTHPDPLPALSAAVEVAAYRIVLEAITNVVRHAAAKQCKVHFKISESGRPHLQIEVDDDGKGLPVKIHAGVGLQSIRERAEELGGSLTIESLNKGTKLTARLPLALSRNSYE